jgi:PIN domain nuclease of toxin-antitoxin system
MLNLDTHILIHALNGTLSPVETTVLEDDADWGISAIVLWEIEKLHAKRRIRFGLHTPQLVQVVAGLHVWPITQELCLNLRRLDFASDPADELIGATSLTHGVPLVTRDQRIRTTKLFACLGD